MASPKSKKPGASRNASVEGGIALATKPHPPKNSDLSGNTDSAENDSRKEAISCEVEGFHNGVLYGHAWNAETPGVPLTLELYDGEERITSVIADSSRPDLAKPGSDNPRCGFEMTVPE